VTTMTASMFRFLLLRTSRLRRSPSTLSGETGEDVLRLAEDRDVPFATVDVELRARNRLGIEACVLDRDSAVGIPVVN